MLLDKELRDIDEAGERERAAEQERLFAERHDGLVFMAKNDRKRIDPKTVKSF